MPNFRLTLPLVTLLQVVVAFSLQMPVEASPPDVAGQPDCPLYEAFKTPPSEAKPFARWWWNGNQVNEAELLHELDVMQAAGIGGIEINPVGLPGGAERTDDEPIDWLSPKWNRLLRTVIDRAHEHGMVVDLIVGSGWPFGGRFLDNDETIQGIRLNTRPLKGPGTVRIATEALMALPGRRSERTRSSLKFLRLIPQGAKNADACIDLLAQVSEKGEIEIDVPEGRYTLCAGVLQDCFRNVVLGAPGADGPVLDHFEKPSVEKYLNRMSDTLNPELGGRMGDRIRAMFCDSIELSGANWTDDMAEQFQQRRGYSLEPYLPFLFSRNEFGISESFADSVDRVRYDFSRTLIEVFHERFVRTFHDWCHQNGMLSRYQAYGIPWLYGMLDGYRIPDIPEGDTWLYFERPNVGQLLNGIRYAVWNKYAASGAHLSGRRLIGCEAMTNTAGVFRASLEDVKRASDLNFITGINHSILHGYSYSSPKAAFPGWVRYGTFFNEKNTWWPYFPFWAEYHARIAAVLQASTPQTDIAILGPTADVYAKHGLNRQPMIDTPWYLHELWQAIHQNGCSADYISDDVMRHARFENGKLRCGEATYEALIVTEVESTEPATAEALTRLAEAGGRIIFVGKAPSRAASLHEATLNDKRVRDSIQRALAADRSRVAVIAPPPESVEGQPDTDRDNLLAWTAEILNRFHIARAVEFDRPDRRLFQIYHRDDAGRDIFFLANQDLERTLSFTATFNTGKKTLWLWDPQTGARHVYPHGAKPNELAIELGPMQSMLLVFEPNMPGQAAEPDQKTPLKHIDVKGPWQATLQPHIGDPLKRTFDRLVDLGTSDDPALNTFAGTLVYKTHVSLPTGAAVLDLGKVEGISEVMLGGKPLGIRWFGRHTYPIDKTLRPGDNLLEVKVTTVLYNYCRSLKDNPTAAGWTGGGKRPPQSAGLIGPVRVGVNDD